MSKKQYSRYTILLRRWYQKHKKIRGTRNNPFLKAQHIMLDNDPAVARYFTAIRNRPNNFGYLSPSTRYQTYASCKHFLQFLNKPLTNTAISELVTIKKENPNSFSIEDQLESFVNPPDPKKLQTRRHEGTTILGLFKANRARLSATSNTHLPHNKTKPISEGILREIRSKLDQRSRDLFDMQAFSGQRIQALAKLPLEQYDLTTDSNFAILTIKNIQNKSRLEHETLIPLELAKHIIERSKQLHNTCGFPNYEELWKSITKFAEEFYGVRLTSHYLRKRFASIASETPMDVNQWDSLMGSKKNKEHDAPIYNLHDTQKLIKSYNTYLVRPLSFENETTSQQPSYSQELTDLKEIIILQQTQIEKLTKALTKS